MQTYSSRTKTTSRRRRSVVAAVLVLVAVYAFAPTLRASILAVVTFPVDVASAAWGAVVRSLDGFVANRTLAEEARVLLHRVETLETENARLGGVERQYADMLESFGRDAHASSTLAGRSPFAVASVAVRPPHAPFDVFGIDAGASDAVAVGDRVVYRGITIGTVELVEERVSYVRLFSSPQNAMTVRIGGVDVEAIGQGGGRLKLQAPRSESIETGDPVFLPTLSLDLIGVVREVESPESDAFQTVYFGAPVALAEIRYVELYQPL